MGFVFYREILVSNCLLKTLAGFISLRFFLVDLLALGACPRFS